MSKTEFDKEYFTNKKKGSSYKNYHEIGERVYKLTLKMLLKLIKEENIDPSRYSILVVGCAFGYEAKAAYDIGFRKVTGSDISEYAIEEAKKTFPEIEFIVDDITNSKLPDNSFDIVMANNVLEHIPDPRKAIYELKRISKKYIILRQDNVFILELFNSLPRIIRKTISKFKNLPETLDTDLTHISQLPKYKWVQLLQSNNIRVKKIFPLSKLPLLISGFHCYICTIEEKKNENRITY